MSAYAKKIAKIRKGGQSGIDGAAMDFAKEHEIFYCGRCPKGGWAEDYPNPPGLRRDEGAGFEKSEHWYDHLEKHIGWKSLGNSKKDN